ncbi:MAG TPA: DUF2723 domain-containing protein [Candidatus Udaeobacter sp.]|nr:DUF2723 domain-containing protein [Candidatus Udaeobacter sp.]
MRARRGPPLGLALVPAAFALLVYGLTLCRTVYFGDSAELSAAAARLGVAHPPGYPLYLLLGRLLVAALPGEPALAVNGLSALAAAATAGLATLLALLLGARPPAALAAGLLVTGSRLVWSQAVVAEVYTLHAALFLGVLAAMVIFDSAGERRWLLLGSYLLGLGLAHHLTIVYAGAGAALILLPRMKAALRSAPAALLLIGLALTLYLVLLVRSRFDPPLDWGNPETLTRLRDHVTARPYQFLVGKLRGPDTLHRLREILGILARDLHPVCVPLILAGLIALRRRPAILLGLGGAILLLIGHALAYGIPDIQAHLVPAAALLALFTALGLDSLAGFLFARRPQVLPRAAWVAPALALLPLLAHYGESDRSQHRSANEFGENLLHALPERSVLLAEGDNQVFLLAYLTAARGERPDLTIVDRDGNLFDDFYAVRAETAPPFTGDFQEQRLAVEKVAIPRWFNGDPPRAVFTSGRTNLPDQIDVRQATMGLVMQLHLRSTTPDLPVASPAPKDPDPWSQVEMTAIRRDAPRGDELTREVAARYWVRRGEGAFEQLDLPAMRAAFDSALAIAPRSPDLASYLGAFLAQNDMIEDSIPLLQQAVRQNPLSVRGWTNLGLALVKSGRRPEGLRALRESLRIQPEQAWVQQAVRQLGSVPPE